MMFALDASRVRQHIDLLYRLRATAQMTEPELRRFFLQHTIGEWYNPLCDNFDATVGHLLYRLTDLVDPPERAAVRISLADNIWLTVEDWRREWEQMHPQGIPELPALQLETVRRALTGSA